MKPERLLELYMTSGELTQEEVNEGFHYCLEFDGLLVGPGTAEALFCHCDIPKIEEWKASDEAKKLREDIDGRSQNQQCLDKLAELDEELGLQ